MVLYRLVSSAVAGRFNSQLFPPHILNETLNCDPVFYDLNVGGTVKSIPILTLARLQHGYQTIKGTLPQCV